MTENNHLNGHATYVVRVSRDGGGIRGVLVHVATGERLTFVDVEGAGQLLRDLIETDLGTAAQRGMDAASEVRQPLIGG